MPDIVLLSPTSTLSPRRIVLPRILLLLFIACAMGYGVLKLDNPRITGVMLQENGISRTLQQQPYVVGASRKIKHRLTFTMDYFLWQNGYLAVDMLDGCISNVTARPHKTVEPISVPFVMSGNCNQFIIDLSRTLSQGSNEISFEVQPLGQDEATVYLSPVLLGTHATSTIACACLLVIFALALFILARLAGIDKAGALLLTAGFCCYALLLHVRPNLAYSNDLPGHLLYIYYMVDGWWRPYAYTGWEHFHPPFYYFLASRIFTFFHGISSAVSPLCALRTFGLLLYMVFCFYGTRTLKEAVQKHGLIYYVGVSLIVFWPLAPIMATRISNDIPVYAAWTAGFYYLARWFRERRLSDLQITLALTGLAISFKTSSIMFAAVVAACILYALVNGRLRVKELLLRRSLLALLALFIGILCNTGRLIYTKLHGGDALDNYLSPGAREVHPAEYFTHFEPMGFITHPVVMFDKEVGYLNYFLKTMLYNEQQLGGVILLPAILNGLFLLLLAVIAVATIIGIWRDRAFTWVPFISGALIPLAGPFIFMLLKHYMFCQSFRFIVPMLIPLLVLYARGMIGASERLPTRVLYWLGLYSGAGLAIGGIVLNLWLYSHGQYS